MSDDSGQFDLRRLLKETRVSELALTHVPRLALSQSLDEAAAEMRKVSHGSALVCDGDRLVGIITERDLMQLLATQEDFTGPVANFMTSSPETLSDDDRLLDAVQLMDRGGYRRLPVIDRSGCPAGVVDVKTIMNFVVDHVPATVYNQASTALLTVRSAEGA
jgi:CBS domain-containing protein